MKRTLLILLVCLCSACSPAISSPTASPSIPPGNYSATKLYQLTAELLTATALSPKNDATVNAIVSTKYAMGTAMAETMTAIPTLTLTATIPPLSPKCMAHDLQASFTGTNGATQSITFGVSVTNVKGSPCFLPLWPQAVLVDASGNALDIQYSFIGHDNLPYDAHATLGLPVDKTAYFGFQWGNWCMPAVVAGVFVRVSLPGDGDRLNIPTGLTAGGVCNASSSPSWVGVFPFTLP